MPFDIEDGAARRAFLEREMPQALAELDASMPPRWGAMSAQHMVEHLIWALEGSRGLVEATCSIPEPLQERFKRFLHDDVPMQRNFRNALLPAEPVALRYESLDKAREAFRAEVRRFYTYAEEHPEARHTHPVFGLLDREEWERMHYKHFRHHLAQFGLLGDDE